MNEFLFKRSIYIEIRGVDRNGTATLLKEAMALTIPPESIRVKQTQRKTKTPTPGGLFIDDYGLGTASISISGDTSNSDQRLTIVGPGRTPRLYDGREAYFEFRKRIVRWSNNNQGDYVMHLYDLTHKKSRNVFLGGEFARNHFDAWEVILDDFGTDRTKSKPFFYPYSIEFTAVRPLGEWNPASARITQLNDVLELIEAVNIAASTALLILDIFASNLYEAVSEITSVVTGINTLVGTVADFGDKFIEYQNKTLGLFNEVLNETESIITAGVQTIVFPVKEYEAVRASVRSIREDANSLIQTIKEQGTYIENSYSNWDTTEISSTAELDSSILAMEIPVYEIARNVKMNTQTDPIASVSVLGEVLPVYGYSEYIVKDNTSLERLALEFYGDPDLKIAISAVNDIYSDDELSSVTKLKLPIFTPSVRLSANEIYANPSDPINILGRDIKIDQNGDLLINSSGDYHVTTGEDTVVQSIFLRLNEEKGRQIRNQSFGVYASVGNALNGDSPIDLLTVSVRETLLQDVRISDVYDLDVIASGDIITQSFRYVTINQIDNEYSQGGI